MARRIDRAAILRIESMTAKYFNAEIWPASWWRDTKCLLPGARQTQGSMPAPLAQELFVARTLKEAPEHVLSFTIFGLNHTLGLSCIQVEDAFLMICPEPDKSTAITIRRIFHKLDVPASRRAFLRDKALKFYKLFEHKQYAWTPEEREFLIDSFISGCCDADVETSPVDRWLVVRQLQKSASMLSRSRSWESSNGHLATPWRAVLF